MTRKRFIKLQMAKGKSRNEAQRMAKRANKLRVTYQAAYTYYAIFGLFDNLKSALKRVVRDAKICAKELEQRRDSY